MEAEGPASWEPRTVFQVLEETVKKNSDRPAIRYKRAGVEVKKADSHRIVLLDGLRVIDAASVRQAQPTKQVS